MRSMEEHGDISLLQQTGILPVDTEDALLGGRKGSCRGLGTRRNPEGTSRRGSEARL